MVGYVGADPHGEALRAGLLADGVGTNHVGTADGPTSQVLIFLDEEGERTMFSTEEDLLRTVSVPRAAVDEGDLVYFAAWEDHFAAAMAALASRGVRIVSVPPPRLEVVEGIDVEVLLGSSSQFEGTRPEQFMSSGRARLKCVVETRAGAGAILYDSNGSHAFPALPGTSNDATGAGDAFAAGLLLELARGGSVVAGIDRGLSWGAAAIGHEESIPPTFGDVFEN
jgi:sugar/nucleoside kinase (ribokinase family)